MPLQVTIREFLTDHKRWLGSTPWLTIDRERLQVFARFTDMGFAGGGGADLVNEIDPFAALSLTPFLLGGILQITDAAANRIVAINECTFIAPIPVDTEFQIQATLLSGKL